MTYLSVCSGIEAASVAWEQYGFKPIGFSEIEPFPSAVLEQRFPAVKNYGDMTKYKEWDIGQFDILVGGTPCQSFSVAGLRKGLTDPRGNLMLTYGAIADHFKPRWIVWENVPGVLSSYSGKKPPSKLQRGQTWETTETSDFGGFLTMLAELGYGFAYRILDAQYVRVESHRRAVPQRRRRVFVVGYLGDWRRAASILFESESLSRYTPPGRKTGERVAGTIAYGVGERSECGHALRANASKADKHESTTYITQEISPALRAKENTSNRLDSMAVVAQPYEVGNCLTARTAKGRNTTLDEGQTPVVSFAPAEVGPAMGASGPPYSRTGNERVETEALAISGYRVRRLTPRECERLQGFPDDWTKIEWHGKPADKCPDGPRYKAIGNSMAVNVMSYIGKRIKYIQGGNQ